ncbi:MAG: pilus assembly protein PilM [bacterium]
MLSFLGSKEIYVGLDVGSYFLKIVVADSNWQDMKNLKSCRVDWFTKVPVQNITDKEEISARLSEIFSAYKAQKKVIKVIGCISSPNVIVRTIEVPKKTNMDKEGAEIARNYIPYKIEEARYIFYTLNEDIPDSPDKKEVLIVSFLLEDVIAMNDILAAAGLEKVAVEFDELGVWRLLEGTNYQNFRNQNNIVVDLGYSITKIMVFNNGKLKQMRNLRIGGEEIRKRIIEKTGSSDFTEDQFERISFNDPRFAPIISRGFEAITKEIKRTLIAYKGKLEFSNVYIIGGMSYIEGIADYFSRETSLNVSSIDLSKLSNIIKIDRKIESDFKKQIGIYINALGLALGHGQQKFVRR